MRCLRVAGVFLGVMVLGGAVSPASVVAQESSADTAIWTRPIMAPVRVLIDGINSGDIQSVEKAHAPGATIVDEIPPYYWSGPGAYRRLMRDFDAFGKAQGIEEFLVTLDSVDQVQVTGDRGYVALSADVVSRTKGVTSRDSGRFVIALARLTGEWQIVHWSWVRNPPETTNEEKK